MKFYPIKLTAVCKDYIWGGSRLREEYEKIADSDKIAESWELSCHKDGESVIANGEFAGTTLTEFIEKAGKEVLGEKCCKFEYFPILIKLIDAKDKLSVQVHPDNEYAKRVEGGYGKTEMYYVVDCEPGAEVLYGFKHNVSREEFERRIKDNTLLEVINSVKVHKGDVFFIEAGTLHAIGKGILIAEIQQNSNITYRIFDYGRVGADGNPRQLHIDKAVDVTDLTPPKYSCKPMGKEEVKYGYTEQLLSKCEYFRVKKLNVQEECTLKAENDSFNSILVLDGEGELDGVKLKKGESCFIPSGYGKYNFVGKAEIIVTDID